MTVALALLVCTPGSASAGPVDSWTGTFGGPGNSMANPGETTITAANAARLTAAWVSAVPGGTVYAPPVAGGLAYRMMDEQGPGSYLAATNVRTGATVWTLHGLPYHLYWDALAVTGHYVIVTYDGISGSPAGGLLLIDTSLRTVVWSRSLPPSSDGWSGNSTAGVPYTDGARIYLSGSGNWINTYRLSDGALLWTGPISNNQGTTVRYDGFAVANGVVYSMGEEGLVARAAATGRRLWGAPGFSGRPVIAGGRVFGFTPPRNYHLTLGAVPAGGCGRATCAPLWQAELGTDLEYPVISAADTASVFVTYRRTTAPASVVVRVGAATGQVQWTTVSGTYIADLVKGSDTIWMFEAYNAAGSEHYRIVGFSATATSSVPLRTIPMTDRSFYGFPQHLSIVGGSLLQKLNGGTLAAYRVPGT